MANRWRGAGRERLGAVASMIPPGARVADVGTDHGILPRHLLASGRASHCIATDRTPGAVAALERLMDGRPRRHTLELRAGDGLSVLRREDGPLVVILAGIGARSICRVLERSDFDSLTLRRLVLQPQTDPPLVRRWLVDHAWAIVEERMAFDRGRYYEVIAAEPATASAEPSHPTLTRDELLEAGPCLARSPDPRVRRYWSDRLDLYDAALDGVRAGPARERVQRRRDRAARILDALPRGARGGDPGGAVRS